MPGVPAWDIRGTSSSLRRPLTAGLSLHCPPLPERVLTHSTIGEMNTSSTAGPAENTGLATATPSRITPIGFTGTAGVLQQLPICKRTLYNWREEGKIPYLRIGRRILYHLPSIESALLRLQRNAD